MINKDSVKESGQSEASLKEKKQHRNDLILILSVLVLAAGWLLWTRLAATDGAYVVVKVQDVETARYPLDTDLEVRLETEDGGYNILVIRNGKADVIEASCPDKICVDQHSISRTGQKITCLPNKTVIEVVGPDSEDAVDF